MEEGQKNGGGPGAMLWPARVGLALAIAGAGYLATISLLGGAVAGCGPGSGCDRVLSSRWAYWLGIPVSLPAGALYAALLAATWKLGPDRGRRNLLRTAAMALSALIVAAALWFTLLQYAVIHSWCRFCLATHVCALFSAVWLLALAFRAAPVPERVEPDRPFRSGFRTGLALGLLGIAVLVGGQLAVVKRLYVVAPIAVGGRSAADQLNLYSGQFELDPDALPAIGSASAQGFAIVLYDYTCAHCRRLHPMLKEVQTRLAGRASFVTLPVPLESECNPMIPVDDPANSGACEYARLALAVWRARPAAFREYDDWLFASTAVPALPDARAKAENLVGKDALEEALGDPWVRRQIAMDVRIYITTSQETNSMRLPQLIFADAAVSGAANDAGELEKIVGARALLSRSGAPRGDNH